MLATAPRPLPSDLRQLTSRRPESPVPFVQGTYYLLIGLWPVLAIDSLLAGSAADSSPWQLCAFGLAVALVGAVLLFTARRQDFTESAKLGVLLALALAAADVALVLKGSAPPIYLGDAAIQAAFVVWWGRNLVRPDPEVVSEFSPGLT